MTDKRCEEILEKHQRENGNVVSLLQNIQEVFGYIPEDTVFWFSRELNVPASSFYGVATFYAQFYLKPRGKNIIIACCGTACHVKGSGPIINKLREELKLSGGETTTGDGKFTIESVACVGACSIAPVFIANKKIFGKMTMEKASEMLKGIDKGKGA